MEKLNIDCLLETFLQIDNKKDLKKYSKLSPIHSYLFLTNKQIINKYKKMKNTDKIFYIVSHQHYEDLNYIFKNYKKANHKIEELSKLEKYSNSNIWMIIPIHENIIFQRYDDIEGHDFGDMKKRNEDEFEFIKKNNLFKFLKKETIIYSN